MRSFRRLRSTRSRGLVSRLGLGAALCLALGLLNGRSLSAEEGAAGGFYGIRWGARLAEVPDLVLVESTEQIQTYELRTGAPLLGEAHVLTMHFVAVQGEFARVSMRYAGERNHQAMLSYLQTEFGPLPREPSSMMRGLNQQFTWRTADTEVNLTYHSYQEHGQVFVESRTLAPRFNDVLPDNAF